VTRGAPGAPGTADAGRGDGGVEPGDRPPLAVVIETAKESRVDEGHRLAGALGVPVLGSRELTRGEVEAERYLVVTKDALELGPAQRGRSRPGRGELAYRAPGVRVDLGGLDPRVGPGGLSRKQPIAKAVGRESHRVLDGTGGLGQDARLLAAIGHEVLVTERSPVLHALLADGLRRAEEDPATAQLLGGRLRLWPEPADVREVLDALAAQGETAPDAAYLDPMFPPRRKATALARKSVRMIRDVVGADEDAAEVLADVRARVRRVVVKRPPDAEPVAGDAVRTIETKMARYDVYVDPTRPVPDRGGGRPDGHADGDGDDRGRRPDDARTTARASGETMEGT